MECFECFAFELNIERQPARRMFPLVLIDLPGANTDMCVVVEEPAEFDPKGATV